MKKIGLLKGIRLCKKYTNADSTKRAEIQKQRLSELVQYAKMNSPYYHNLYHEIKNNFELCDLPPVNKVTLMENFDQWVTDYTVHLEDLYKFMENKDNIGRKFMGKYLVFTTSGSTGNPLVTIVDKTSNNMMTAINVLRSFTRKEDLISLMMHGGKTIGIFATGGFYLGNSSVRARLLSMPWKKKQIRVTSALLPIPQIVEELNHFKPAMLGGYPSILELLIEEQISGRLHINPVIVMTGGEYLSENLRTRLVDTFHCYVQTSYSCTEGGTVACECSEHHFHINEDWIIVEPVDKNNNQVEDGVLSDKILLTNLFNYSQPFIRYEVTDRIVMHHERCSCGNPSPWLTIEGRTDDVVTFSESGKEIKVAPLAIYPILKEVHSIRRFQVLVYPDNKICLRIIPTLGYSKKDAFKNARLALSDFLATHSIHSVTILLDEEEPKQHDKSGKFKHIINCCK